MIRDELFWEKEFTDEQSYGQIVKLFGLIIPTHDEIHSMRLTLKVDVTMKPMPVKRGNEE